jgi:hypothetical protein
MTFTPRRRRLPVRWRGHHQDQRARRQALAGADPLARLPADALHHPRHLQTAGVPVRRAPAS